MKRRAWKRIPSGLLALLLILQAFLPLGVVQAGTPGPDFTDPAVPQILMKHTLNNGTTATTGTYYGSETATLAIAWTELHCRTSN